MIYRLHSGDAIELLVGDGDNSQTWSLPKPLLAHVSPFFAAALDGRFSESKSHKELLPEDDPAAFELFVQWLYIGETGKDSPEHTLTHVRAWTLGDKLGCPVFQDRAMLKLLRFHAGGQATIIEPQTSLLAYEGSAANSKLRAWALQQFRCEVHNNKLGKMAEEWASITKTVPDFGSDYVRDSASANAFGDKWWRPESQRQQFLELLTYKG